MRTPKIGPKDKAQEFEYLVGWREWISLPTLGIDAIKAKIDTGARTSALHTFDIEAYRDHGKLKVQFKVHPLQQRQDVHVTCNAEVIDERVVSDSGGHREKRYVIEIPIRLGQLEFPVEMSLTNRDSMQYRMLLGRTALRSHVVIDPSHSFLLGHPQQRKRSK